MIRSHASFLQTSWTQTVLGVSFMPGDAARIFLRVNVCWMKVDELCSPTNLVPGCVLDLFFPLVLLVQRGIDLNEEGRWEAEVYKIGLIFQSRNRRADGSRSHEEYVYTCKLCRMT